MTQGDGGTASSRPTSSPCLQRLQLAGPSANTHPGPPRPRRRRCCPAGPGGGVTDEEGAEGTDPSQNRPLLRVSAPSLPQSPSQQDPPGLRGRATRSPASAWRNASLPALRHIREGAFARQPRAWRVAGNPTFTVSLAPICGHTSATSRAPEGAWCRQRPGWEGHRPGDLWGGIWTHQLRRVLFVSIYLSFWLRRAEPRVGSGAQWGSATLLRRGRTGHS